jgi:hypothetical protein
MDSPAPEYRRPFGRPRSPEVQRAIAALDPHCDYERIAQLLVVYEFPFDIVRALEVALFHTYGSQSIARLLDRTGEFRKRGQKRYDDTALLIQHFIEAGLDSDLGARAIAQINHIHSHFQIPNDDYLFVLWTFIDFPIEWMREFGWRPFTEHECVAWFRFWQELGRRMGIADIPADKPAFDTFVSNYEAREFVPNEASRNVVRATIDIMAGWFPSPFASVVEVAALSLVRPQLLHASGFKTPPAWFRTLVRTILKVRRVAKRFVSFENYPTTVASIPRRTYPGNAYTIESLGPEYASGEARRSASTR